MLPNYEKMEIRFAKRAAKHRERRAAAAEKETKRAEQRIEKRAAALAKLSSWKRRQLRKARKKAERAAELHRARVARDFRRILRQYAAPPAQPKRRSPMNAAERRQAQAERAAKQIEREAIREAKALAKRARLQQRGV